MKKLMYLLAGLILVVAMVSCEKKGGIPNNDMGVGTADVMKAVVEMGENIPESDNGVIPEVIPGENRGGNRTCDEVYEYFWIWDELDVDDPDYAPVPDYYCGEKVDYDENGDGFGDGFDHYEGLTVDVEGRHISFSIPGECLEIDGIAYKVGAVIVKGSNAANVYFYKDGEIFDSGLAAPGDKHMVSNLTFCLVPCEDVPQDPEYVIAIKSYLGELSDEICTGSGWGKSVGTDYGGFPQYVVFDPTIIPNEYMFYRYSEHIGTITAEIVVVQIEGEDTDCMSIAIETNEGFENYLFNDSYLYFGSLTGLLQGGADDSFLPYYYFPYVEFDDDCAVSREFLINLETMALVTE